MKSFFETIINFFLWLVEWLWDHALKAMDFILATFLDLAGCLLTLYGLYHLAGYLRTLDPTVGIPDGSVFIMTGWSIALLYAALVVGEVIFRRAAPTPAEYASSGKFAEDWKRNTNTTFKLGATLLVALTCILVALHALTRY